MMCTNCYIQRILNSNILYCGLCLCQKLVSTLHYIQM